MEQNKSDLLIRVFELVNPSNMKIDATGNIPDSSWVTQPEPKIEDPTGPEGDLKDWLTFGIDENGKKIRIKELAFFGEWANGYTKWVRVPINHEQLKSILEAEI